MFGRDHRAISDVIDKKQVELTYEHRFTSSIIEKCIIQCQPIPISQKL